jgi:hypothetical protein
MVESLCNGWACYKPKGVIKTYEFEESDLKYFCVIQRLEFQAPWKETMFVRVGDYLIIPPEMRKFIG